MSTSFSLSNHWKNYDVFARQKINTFRSSRPAVIELAARYKSLLDQIEKGRGKPADEEAEEIIFHEMCEICLWGNATDLSLLTNLTYEDIQKLQGSEARKAAEKNILVNNLPAAYKVLKKAKAEGKTERRVDIVLDNAGFELFVDLILAGYLLSSGLATLVVLHPKDIPWFVSDVLPSDFSELLNALANPKKFYETPSEDDKLQDKTPEPLSDKESDDMSFLFQSWSQMYAEGQVILRPNRFWTHPGSFWRLPHVAEELFQDLKTSNLVIFKGDLNYRKLTGDVSCCRIASSNVLKTEWLTFCRRNGTLRHPSSRPLARWVLAQASMYWPYGLARRMSSLTCSPARMTSCEPLKGVEVTLVRENGLGMASGLWSLCRLVNNDGLDASTIPAIHAALLIGGL